MSKNSAKQNVEQLKDWLAWRKATTNTSSKSTTNSVRFSKADHYNKTRERYGNKSN